MSHSFQCRHKLKFTYILIMTLWSSDELYTNRYVLSACSMIAIRHTQALYNEWSGIMFLLFPILSCNMVQSNSKIYHWTNRWWRESFDSQWIVWGWTSPFSINKTIITVSSEQTNQITRKKLEKRRKLNISSERESWALTQCSCLHESFLLLKCVVLHLFCVCVSLAASEMSYERCQTERHVTC